MHHLVMMLIFLTLAGIVVVSLTRREVAQKIPISVNYHFTRKCNASCKFCFHTAKTSYVCSEADAFHGLEMLKRAGMKKINFAGGEPFLYPKFLAKMLRYCKEALKLESVSIVTNGSKVTESFLRQNAKYIDILAVSCDSFDTETNVKIGRTDQGNDYGNFETLKRIAAWCRDYNIKFKLNSVICRLNVHQDMAEEVAELGPFRWKVFQVLLVPGENDSSDAKRNATNLLINDKEFDEFCSRHAHLSCFVPECNRLMKSSYLIVDEYMRFLGKDVGTTSASILDVGVERALAQVEWDEAAFHERGGVYEWGRPESLQGAPELLAW